VKAPAKAAEYHGSTAARHGEPGEAGDEPGAVLLELAVIVGLGLQRCLALWVSGQRRVFFIDGSQEAVGLPDVRPRRIQTLSNRKRLVGVRPGIDEAARERLQQGGQLVPALAGSLTIAYPLADPARFPVLPSGLIPAPSFLQDSTQLVPRYSFETRLLEALGDLERRLATGQSLVPPSFGQGQGTQLAKVYGLSSQVPQLFGDFQCAHVGAVGFAKAPQGSQRISELGTKLSA
jgi:hypothetical protein